MLIKARTPPPFTEMTYKGRSLGTNGVEWSLFIDGGGVEWSLSTGGVEVEVEVEVEVDIYNVTRESFSKGEF